MSAVCPFCSEKFSPGVSAEQGALDSMQNMFDCPHCFSVLKWEGQEIKLIREGSAHKEAVEAVEKTGLFQEPVAEPIAEPIAEPVNEPIAEPVNEPIAEPVNEPIAEPEESPAEEPAPEPAPQTQDFSDVENYGNSEEALDKGFLRYDLKIEGLDSLEIEKQVQSILEENRLQWSAQDILKEQVENRLILKNLNSVKAFYLVSRLSFLPVKLSWKQYRALNAESPQPAAEEEESV